MSPSLAGRRDGNPDDRGKERKWRKGKRWWEGDSDTLLRNEVPGGSEK